MKRTELKKIYSDLPAFDGQTVTVAGWARSVRDSKAFGFIELNDGSCFKNTQIVFDRAKIGNYDEIAKQNVGASFGVTGKVVVTPENRQPCSEVWNRNRKHDDDRRHQLQHKRRHIQPQRDGIDQPEDHRAQNRTHRAQKDSAAAENRAADQQRGQRDGDHTLPDVDIRRLLILREQAAGQRRKAARGTQADRSGHGRVDGRRAHHVGIIAGRADGEAHAGAKEQRQKQYDQHHCRKRGQQLILPSERRTGQRSFHERKHRLRLVETQKRRAVHNGNVDGVQRRIDDDPGKQTVDAHARLQNRHDQPGHQSRAHRRKNGQHRMARHGCDRAGHSAEREAAVRRQVADVQHRVTQIQRQYGHRADKPKFQRCLYQSQNTR